MERTPQTAQHLNRWSNLELALLVYAAWQARSLPAAWLHSPFDRMGWLAFVIWVAPWCWLCLCRCQYFRGPDSLGRGQIRRFLSLTGFGLAFLGDLGSINVVCHAGLALILVSLAPSRTRLWLWGICALSWMPALGWFGSRLSLSPLELNTVRIVCAALGAAWALQGTRLVAAFVRTRLNYQSWTKSQPRSYERSHKPPKSQAWGRG